MPVEIATGGEADGACSDDGWSFGGLRARGGDGWKLRRWMECSSLCADSASPNLTAYPNLAATVRVTRVTAKHQTANASDGRRS